MPKMKTHRGAAKRFKVTAGGKVMRRHAFKSHLLGHKAADRKRRLRKQTTASQGEMGRLRRMLPFSDIS